MRRRELMAGGLVAALAAPSLVLAKPKHAVAGDVAPEFSISTVNSGVHRLADMRGDVVVINYWASWCAPCRAEMLALDQFMREKAGKGLRIYAVNIESSPPEKAMRDLSGALSFPVGRRLAGKGYGKIDNAVPTNFVIDRKGVVRHAKAGAFSYDSFARLLNPLLAEARPVEVA
ncbi:TlpA family protein disulfide reductase [Caulobacter radicis]|uniref:TlpA family protein disulfide reductase n=1 Tax=Caulobacter radicis TaxID=2172650 RepID=UPI000D573029|nr:TlpA disulfide reductase family protein [Caulobacter radicis]PVM93066.1 TlpA family protein disulfide reductase [Caulobacter radicis]